VRGACAWQAAKHASNRLEKFHLWMVKNKVDFDQTVSKLFDFFVDASEVMVTSSGFDFKFDHKAWIAQWDFAKTLARSFSAFGRC
jgi:hypothetical protein